MQLSRQEQPQTTADPAVAHDIFVRAHTVVSQKSQRERPSPAKWPDEVIVIDMETTTDTAQTLTFGAYRRCTLGPNSYECSEEGLLYADNLDHNSVDLLNAYIGDPKNFPDIEARKFPPHVRLNLYSRTEFVERVFWKAIRRGAMIVGFNLPFDLARLAVKSTPADKGGWSLVLSTRRKRKTGEITPNPERPRIVITSIDSKAAFISLGSILHPQEWPEGRFLDLHTLGRVLRDQSYNLKSACEQFGAPRKMDYAPTGRITFQEITYCRQDVRATAGLLNAMRREFYRHPIELRPDHAYSPASIAKAYLDAMKIARPKEKFNGLK